jgi:hypothetical protein
VAGAGFANMGRRRLFFDTNCFLLLACDQAVFAMAWLYIHLELGTELQIQCIKIS